MSLSSYLERAEKAEEIFARYTFEIFTQLQEFLESKGFALTAPPGKKSISFQHRKISELVISFEMYKDVDLFLKVFLNGDEEGKILLDLDNGSLKFYENYNERDSLDEAIEFVFAKY